MEPPHRAYCIWSVIAFFNLDLQSQFRGSLFQRNVANKTKRTRFQFYGSLLQGSFAKETYQRNVANKIKRTRFLIEISSVVASFSNLIGSNLDRLLQMIGPCKRDDILLQDPIENLVF